MEEEIKDKSISSFEDKEWNEEECKCDSCGDNCDCEDDEENSCSGDCRNCGYCGE